MFLKFYERFCLSMDSGQGAVQGQNSLQPIFLYVFNIYFSTVQGVHGHKKDYKTVDNMTFDNTLTDNLSTQAQAHKQTKRLNL